MPDERIRKQYKIDEILGRLRSDAAQFYAGFAPWPEDLEGWTCSSRELLPAEGERSLVRTVWDDARDQNSRLLIDTKECGSAQDAIEALAESLEANQLSQLPDGLSGNWFVSFVHPEGAPPAHFMAYANLLLVVSSFGRKAVPVEPVVKQLLRRLEASPESRGEFGRLTAQPTRARPGQEVLLRYELSVKPIEGSFLRFSASGGTIFRRHGQLVALPARTDRLEISSWLLEPGREARRSTLTIPVE